MAILRTFTVLVQLYLKTCYRIVFKLLSPTKGSGYIVGAHSMHHPSGLLVLSDRCNVLEKKVTKLHKR